ncbi:MAG: sensor histidine kinase [Thermoactinospora sp.]|nr:sensor histidine kinase [Thermoactinospora sp.]
MILRGNVPRMATVWALTMGVALAWTGAVRGLIEHPVGAWRAAGAIAAMVAFSVLYVRISRAAVAGGRRWADLAAAGVIALALVAWMDVGGEPRLWALLGPIWASAAVLVMSPWPGMLVCAGVAGGYLVLTPETDSGTAFTYVTLCFGIPWANRLQLWFWKIIQQAEAGKKAQAALAVAEERLRFSRDLHDLVGHSLSVIAVKSELAVKLAGRDQQRAENEMAEVRTLAKQALGEIRSAVQGYRSVDLASELRAMRQTLEAAGIACSIDEPPRDLPAEVATLLAWVAREGTTNVLRHSGATTVSITFDVREGELELLMRNDGAGEAGAGNGTGLTGLAERVATLRGEFRAGPEAGGHFVVGVVVPWSRSATIG